MFDKTETKIVYGYAPDGKFTQVLTLDNTDRSQNSGIWQIPAQATEVEPPAEKEGFDRVFDGTAWGYQEKPSQEEEPEIPEPEKPTEQEYEHIDPYTIALAAAIAEQEARLTAQEAEIAALKGGVDNG